MKVMTVAAEVNLSDLLNKPKATLARLASNRRLLLRRRDDEDLVPDHGRARRPGHRRGARHHPPVRRDDAGRSAVMTLAVQVPPAVLPWVRHLPEDEQPEFAAEWLATLTAASEMGNNAAVETGSRQAAAHGRASTPTQSCTPS